jgi:hypothetical protein
MFHRSASFIAAPLLKDEGHPLLSDTFGLEKDLANIGDAKLTKKCFSFLASLREIVDVKDQT